MTKKIECKHYNNGQCTEDKEVKECASCESCYYKVSIINARAFSYVLRKYREYVATTTSDREEELAKEIAKLKKVILALRNRNIQLSQENRKLRKKK